MLRWNCEVRLAAVMCTLPSSVSALGDIVAAFAAHMLDAEQHRAAARAPPRAAWWIIDDVITVETQFFQGGDSGPILGRQYCLLDAHVRQQFHLCQPLKRCFARTGSAIAFATEAMFPAESPP